MINTLRNILLFTVIAAVAVIPNVLAADVIQLRHSVRRAAVDQPVRLGDIAILDGVQAEALAGIVIRPADSRAATGVVRIRVAEVRAVLDDAEVYWGTLDLEGGLTLVRPPASTRQAVGRESEGHAVVATKLKGLAAGPSKGPADHTPFIAAADLLEDGGMVAREIAKAMIMSWGPEASGLQLAIDATAAEALVADATGFSVELLGNPRSDRCNARIAVRREGGRPSRAALARVDVRIIRSVPVAFRDLRAGRKLSRSDFEMASRPVRPSEIVLDIGSLEDRKLQGSMVAGAAMTAGLLKAEFVVERQGNVLILASGTGVQVEAPGVAMEKGRIGDTIECRLRTAGDRDRNARFSAVVIGPGRVRLADR